MNRDINLDAMEEVLQIAVSSLLKELYDVRNKLDDKYSAISNESYGSNIYNRDMDKYNDDAKADFENKARSALISMDNSTTNLISLAKFLKNAVKQLLDIHLAHDTNTEDGDKIKITHTFRPSRMAHFLHNKATEIQWKADADAEKEKLYKVPELIPENEI